MNAVVNFRQAKKGRRALPAAAKIPGIPFAPHAFAPRVRLLDGTPRILITPQAYEDMCHYVDIADGEVGWRGTVKPLRGGLYLIEEAFMLRQEVSPVTTDLLKVGTSELVKELRAKGEEEKLDRLNFWGHSHVDFDTAPSGQDEKRFLEFDKNGCPFMIMGIFNKLGRAHFIFFDFEAGVRVDDARWNIYQTVSDERRAAIEAEMAEKLTAARVIDYTGTGEQPPYEPYFGNYFGGMVVQAKFGSTTKAAVANGKT